MSVLFGGVLGVSEASLKSIYATIIGSNLGACLTPVGGIGGNHVDRAFEKLRRKIFFSVNLSVTEQSLRCRRSWRRWAE